MAFESLQLSCTALPILHRQASTPHRSPRHFSPEPKTGIPPPFFIKIPKILFFL
jgi:hypothetical protein